MLDLMLYTVAVNDLDGAAENYKKLFGMKEVGDRFHNPIGNFDAVPMGYEDGKRVLNLIHPSSDDAPLARLMKERANAGNPHGEGIYMLAFELDDPDAFAKNVEAGGGRITRRDDSQFLWVHPLSSNFVFMELRPRGTS